MVPKVLKGRTIVTGKVKGKVLKLNDPLSVLRDIDPMTGKLQLKNDHRNVSGTILVFPRTLHLI